MMNVIAKYEIQYWLGSMRTSFTVIAHSFDDAVEKFHKAKGDHLEVIKVYRLC